MYSERGEQRLPTLTSIEAIIPARGGSKGIYKKNIRDLGGKPLIYYQIENALSVTDYVTVASDDDEIIDKALNYDVNIVKRPPEISHDLSKTEETLLYVLNELPADIVITLEPTNPLNKPEYILRCLKKVLNGFDSAGCFIEDKSLFYGTQELLDRPMKQHISPRFKETGNCWVTKTDILRRTNNRLGGEYAAVVIPQGDAIHIDSEDDWRIAEAFIEREYFKRHDNLTDYEAYYEDKPDPDGLIRDRTKERDLYILRNSEKIDYLNQFEGKILDYGCGYGFLLSALHDRWDKYGFEVSGKASEIASQYCKIRPFMYPENFFDAVVLNHVIEHLHNPEEIIRDIRNVLKPNGKLVLETPDFDCGVARRFGERFRLLHDKGHISLFNQWGVYQLLKGNLFEIERVSYPYFETDYYTVDNFKRLDKLDEVSPPFYGNTVTFYAYKK